MVPFSFPSLLIFRLCLIKFLSVLSFFHFFAFQRLPSAGLRSDADFKIAYPQNAENLLMYVHTYIN
jgi:hypothetical protein